MQNRHEEYIRIGKDKRTACLMVHGITGTPRYFDDIIPILPEEWGIYNILLDGHGKDVSDFSKTSMEKWRRQVGTILDGLAKEYEEIYIFAHSMGTLLCMEQAQRFADKIKHMVLFAVPLCPRLKVGTLVTTLKVIFERVNEKNELEVSARGQYSIEKDRRLWRYMGFVPRYVELLMLCRKMRGKVCDIKVPAMVFMCGKDEMVGEKSWDYLLDNPHFTKYCLDQSSHNHFDELDFKYVTQEIKKLL